MNQEFEKEIDEDFYWDDDDVCEGCGKPDGEGKCPMCCNFGGVYAAGTEECDFCDYYAECSGLYLRKARRKKTGPKSAPRENQGKLL